MKLKIVVRGIPEVQEFIRSLPYGTVKVGLQAIAEYYLGNDQHGLRHYEPYKYVTRKAAYGQTFQSEKQRRWFWANGGPDMIGNHRTGETAAGWHWKETNNGYGITLENDTEGAHWIWSDKQARQPAMVGHRKAKDKIRTNLAGAIRYAQGKVNEQIKAKKKL
jgi:hypothetical protein